MMRKKQNVNEGLMRGRFIRPGTLNLRGTGFATLMCAASMYKKLKRVSVVFIVLTSFPGLAFNQQPPSPSAVAATNTTSSDIAHRPTDEFNQLKTTVIAT